MNFITLLNLFRSLHDNKRSTRRAYSFYVSAPSHIPTRKKSVPYLVTLWTITGSNK
jgi:hypothetical protein